MTYLSIVNPIMSLIGYLLEINVAEMSEQNGGL